jgi:hypothetical protein
MRAKNILVLIPFVILCFACPAEMWIPIEATPRVRVTPRQVQYLEAVPDRPFIVLGIITPPEDEYETEAEAVKAIREVAAKHGADAILIESQSESTGWKFDSGILGAKGSTVKNMKFRAKAIAWK